jgi:hypothetical protein
MILNFKAAVMEEKQPEILVEKMDNEIAKDPEFFDLAVKLHNLDKDFVNKVSKLAEESSVYTISVKTIFSISRA